VYTKDPKKYNDAKKFSEIKYLEALNLGVQVMDSTAISLCMDNSVPIIVFDLNQDKNIEKIVMGETIGTIIH
jgi:uridylate kinase